VILVVGEDSDKRLHIYKEFYKRQQLQSDVVTKAKEWSHEFGCASAAVDEAAAGLIADLNAAGVRASGAKGRVLDGIQRVQNQLAKAGDGRPRLTVDPSCVNVQNEFESYKWKPEKDMPEKEDDHAMDAVRYLADFLQLPTGAIDDITKIHVGTNTGINKFAELYTSEAANGMKRISAQHHSVAQPRAKGRSLSSAPMDTTRSKAQP